MIITTKNTPMNSSLLDKLHTLETNIAALRKQYHVTATELANLKNRPNYEEQYKQTIETLTRQLDDSQTELDNYAQNHGELQARLTELTHENAKLTDKVHELKEKNIIAIEHVAVIQNWLTRIDNSGT
ncbi:MAG: hypothetical protein Q4G13_08435 [Moraxella sp.]|nr:hypothetical protein [Moraxella sp.]